MEVDDPVVASTVRQVIRSPRREIKGEFQNFVFPRRNSYRRSRSPRRCRSPDYRERRYRDRTSSKGHTRRYTSSRSPSPPRKIERHAQNYERYRSRSPRSGRRSRSSERKVFDKFAHFRNRRSKTDLENNDRRVSIEASDAENKHWATIREKRKKICLEGLSFVWARSPTKDDLEKIYKEHESVEKSLKSERRRMEKEERKRRKSHKKAEAKTRRLEKLNLKAESSSSDLTSDSDSDSDHEQKKKKKSSKKSSKKDKKSKKKKDKKSKKKKRKHESSEDSGDEIHSTKKIKKRKETKSTSEDEWVEVTKTMHAEDEQRVREENSHIIGPAIPEYIIQKDELPKSSTDWDVRHDASINKDMLRGEAAAMAAYVAQGKRIPRRGEIGLSSDEITSFEKVGYVMSGTRHKAMEATRLRKENQIMTADEKRMLSGFSQEHRKEKEELVLQRMRHLVDSKKNG